MSENHIFVLQKVINDLLDIDVSLEAAMIKLNYFGRLIKNEELITYTDFEINGYTTKDLPPYRKAIATLYIKMQAGANHHTGELPVEMLPAPFNKELRYIGIFEGIKILETTAAKSDKTDSQFLRKNFPMPMLRILQPAATKLYKSDVQLLVVEAWLLANSNAVIKVLSNVRSRLLTFAMEIAERFGYDINISSFKEEANTNNQVINNFFKNEIINYGSGNITNTGNESSVAGDIEI